MNGCGFLLRRRLEGVAGKAHDRHVGVCCSQRREFEAKGCAFAGSGFNPDVPAVFLQDAVADGETEPCAFMFAGLRVRFGGEEGIEDAVQVLWSDA
jgi:hypothetical protein